MASQLYLILRFLLPLVTFRLTGKSLLLSLRNLVFRTFVGSFIGFLSSLGLRRPFLLFDGKPAWLCCIACKVGGRNSRAIHTWSVADLSGEALITSTVLHWITKPTNSDSERRQKLGIGFAESSATSPSFDLDRSEIEHLRELDEKNSLSCSIYGLGLEESHSGSTE
ncbi:hypothetical protein DOTSEDRAFT_33727 [Dothistroma septosporum NZE10]|uniref:Uncharacterized protein n=1 Tax=Dothistroma septosporum (strain NZE10 / CBS 128990) TaxID=675120 RepID=N1PS23_DOTSN|nr:hypothetical protein DOTSEDRAFT_33727 [Dothistroma septosporum NZE10]